MSTSERGLPFTTAGFARMIERAGKVAKLSFKAHPHMLRHACGYALANRGHDTRALQAYLGHRNIQQATRSWRRIGSRAFGRTRSWGILLSCPGTVSLVGGRRRPKFRLREVRRTPTR